MTVAVSFQCAGCNARLRAPIQAVGRSGSCPNCGHKMKVRPQAPAPEGPVLVGEDGPALAQSAPAWMR
jgi:DNA-directed RNA polymerase subunit RPC12/RpoP